MKLTICNLRFAIWMLVLCLFAPPDGFSATVTGTIVNSTGTGYPARLSFIPLSNPQSLNNTILTSANVNKVCGSTGTFSVVLQQGDYRVQIDDRDKFLISVPTGTNSYQLNSLLTQTLLFQFKFPYLPMDLNGYTNSITNLLTLAASNGIFSGSLRLPRLTQTQRDACSPTTNGLIILNTSNGTVNFTDGTNWVTIGSGNGNVSFTDFSPAYLGTNGSIYPTNLDNSRISASAAIDKTKISTSGTWPDADIPSLDASKIGSGTLAAARLPALTGDVTSSAGSAATTIAAGAVDNGKVATGAAIAKSKISGSSTWAVSDIPNLPASQVTSGTFDAARLGTIQTTADGGSHALKQKGYIVLSAPQTCDGAGAIIATNDNTLKYFGQAAFSGSAAASGNFVEYRLSVPEDLDTAVDLKVERFKFRLGAADTAAHSYVITMASVADSASFDSPTLGSSVTLTFAGDASGASGDIETISAVTLTGWRSALTPGQLWVIRLARNGDTDASTQTSYSGPLVISYGSTQ